MHRCIILTTIVALSAAVSTSACHAPPQDPPRGPSPGNSSASADAGVAKLKSRWPALADAPPLTMPAEEPPKCEDVKDVHIFIAPGVANVNAPLKVMAFSERPIAGELRIAEKGGAVAVTSDVRHGGPPYFYVAEVPSPKAGGYVASFVQKACDTATATLATNVGKYAQGARKALEEDQPAWVTRRWWTPTYENLYSAWIEILFDAPDGEMPSWAALHEVLRDPKRNFLYEYLGGGEDSRSPPTIRPDCADLPYMLRAYFAYKLGLPFGIGICDRGGGGRPPSCQPTLITNEDPPAKIETTANRQLGSFMAHVVADHAHSGSARQPFDEQNSDYYPVALTWESLRPGTVYGDPYGHVLMVAKRVPQTGERGGTLIAVDGQPDGTVAKKRFWRGNFLYAKDRELGGPGFKRFRPITRRGDKLVRLGDREIKDVSREQEKLDVEGFYDKMDEVLSPRPLDPHRAMMESLAALEEQVKTRVKSVDNGRKWLETGKGPASMPDGPEIFETSGAWEDYSTPSRDLRILIAIDVVRGFPARVARRPERYAMPEGRPVDDVQRELEDTLKKELDSRIVEYTRTDNSPFKLTLSDVTQRSALLEMAYNPNECVELRWGAKPGSDEAKPCRDHAPSEQVAKMEGFRTWFHDRRRPARK